LPDDTWQPFVGEIRGVLVKNGYERMPAALAARPIGFEIRIPTILRGPELHLFDATFYWED
jgi:hypothetical protein